MFSSSFLAWKVPETQLEIEGIKRRKKRQIVALGSSLWDRGRETWRWM